MGEQLTVCISGSFKFKPEIDELHDEFTDLGVQVLEPMKGWLYIPSRLPQRSEMYRPLPNERGLSQGQVENNFLSAARKAHFVYLHNAHHYMGLSAATEVGFAHGCQKPVFSRLPLQLSNFEYDLASHSYWSNYVTVATPAEAVGKLNDLQAKAEENNVTFPQALSLYYLVKTGRLP